MLINEHFIKEIYIEKVLHLEHVDIKLSSEKRQHLLVTGKNGTGKTSLLQMIRNNLTAINEKNWQKYRKQSERDEKVILLPNHLYDFYSS